MHARDEMPMAIAFFGDYSRGFIFEAFQHMSAHVAHDTHVDHDVRAIGNFDTDFCQWRIERTHAKWDHIHRTTLHAATEFF